MARYWVGDVGDRPTRATDPADARDASARSRIPAPRRERVTDAVRRTLAGNVTSDDASD